MIFFALPHGAVRDFLLTAHDLGYINGDYVFLDVILFDSRGMFSYSWTVVVIIRDIVHELSTLARVASLDIMENYYSIS